MYKQTKFTGYKNKNYFGGALFVSKGRFRII